MMKKLFILINVLLIALFVNAQYPAGRLYPVNQSIGADSTLVTSKGGLKGRLINFVFADTTTANLQPIKNYAGAQIVTYKPSASDSGTIWLRNGTATKWLRGSGSIDVTSITFDNDTTGIICFSSGVCDTFQINNLTNVVNNIVQNFNDSTVYNINDSTLIICNGAGVCDTIHLGNSNTYYFLSPDSLVTCDTVQNICVGDSCYQQQLCDTILIPRTPATIYQNLLWKNGSIVEAGDPLFGTQASMHHDTYFNTAAYELRVQGAATLRPVLSVKQNQWSQLSPSIMGLYHYGKYPPTLLDANNPVGLYFNYTDPFMVPATGGLAGDTLGYLGIGEYGYMLMTNAKGGQANFAVDDYNSKQVGISMYTYGTSTKGVGIFANKLPSAYNYGSNPAADSTLNDAMVTVFHTTGQVQFPQYTTGAFPITSPTYIIAQDASGNLFQYPPGGLPVGPGTGLLFARDDARNNSGGAMYFSAASQSLFIDSINSFLQIYLTDNGIIDIGRKNDAIFYSDTTRTQIAGPFSSNNIYVYRDTTFIDLPSTSSKLLISNLNTGSSTDSVLVWNTATNRVGYRNASSFGISGITADNGLTASTATNVQLGGTLLGNTIINTDLYSLTLSTATGGVIPLVATATTGIAVSASATSGLAVNASATTGVALKAASDGGTYGATIQGYANSSNISVPVLNIQSLFGGSAAGANFGGQVDFNLQTSNFATIRNSNSIKSFWTVATDGPRTSQLIFTGVDSSLTDNLLAMGDRITLTESSATQFATTTIPDGRTGGGEIIVTVSANDAIDFQARTLRFIWAAENKGGTTTITISTPEEVVAVSGGTLTCTITAVDGGSGVVQFKANAVSSLTQTTLRCSYQISKNF